MSDQPGSATNATLFHFWFWLVFTILVPAAGLVLLWPIGAFLLSVPQPFVTTFSSGDGVLLGGLILFAAAADATHQNLFAEKKDYRLFKLQITALFFGIISVLIFGFIRAKVTLLGQTHTVPNQGESDLFAVSLFALTVLVASTFFSIFVKATQINVKVLSLFSE